jgi:hypothetical protein
MPEDGRPMPGGDDQDLVVQPNSQTRAFGQANLTVEPAPGSKRPGEPRALADLLMRFQEPQSDREARSAHQERLRKRPELFGHDSPGSRVDGSRDQTLGNVDSGSE